MPRPGCGVELSTRADTADLPPVTVLLAVVVPAKPVELLKGEAELDTWRIVEVFSKSGLPFDLHLAWASGGGSGAEAKVTVARSARICVYARSMRLVAENLCDKPNRVGVTVADGYAVTRNQWEQRGAVVEGSPLALQVPPFAETFRVELADPTTLASTLIRLRDGVGTTRALFSALLQPAAGIPVGGAATVEVSGNDNVDARVVFHLSL